MEEGLLPDEVRLVGMYAGELAHNRAQAGKSNAMVIDRQKQEAVDYLAQPINC